MSLSYSTIYNSKENIDDEWSAFISNHYDVNKFRISPKVTEDIYVYNYLKYGDQLKNTDLFRRYYDLHLRKIENIMVLLDPNI